MRKLWDNPELARTMGRRAAARFEELFTSEQMAANYTALYHDLVDRRATGSSAASSNKQTQVCRRRKSKTTHRPAIGNADRIPNPRLSRCHQHKSMPKNP
jgi:hypothetical protein